MTKADSASCAEKDAKFARSLRRELVAARGGTSWNLKSLRFDNEILRAQFAAIFIGQQPGNLHKPRVSASCLNAIFAQQAEHPSFQYPKTNTSERPRRCDALGEIPYLHTENDNWDSYNLN